MRVTNYISSIGLFLLTLLTTSSFGQYGYEWINFNQQYYKISTAQNGFYRITYANLQNQGFPVDNVDPRRIKLYHRGNEVAINFEGQLDARFDPADYLEFYGIKNDGTLDEKLYIAADAQPHKYHNLYSDTTAYFLTWSLDGTNGKRIQKFKENNVGGLPAESFHHDEKIILQTNRYSLGLHYPIGQPSAENFITPFDYGEGWTGPNIRKGQSADFVLTGLAEYYNLGTEVPKLEMVLIGANNLQHKADIYVGPNASSLRLLTSAEFSYYYSYNVSEDLLWSDFTSSNELVVRVSVTGVSSAADFVSVSSVKLVYPEILNQNNLTEKYFLLKDNVGGKSYVEIANVPNNTRLFDITNPFNLVQIEYNRVASNINAIVPSTTSKRKIYSSANYLTNPKIAKTNFNNINPNKCDFVIISHPSLRKPSGNYSDVISAYAGYRASPAGGAFDTLTLNIEKLYDQFNYGEISSLALYNFFDYLSNETSVEYVFIIGKGLTPNYNSHRIDFSSQQYPDLIPTGGYPGNDVVFSTKIGSSDYSHKISTGRLAVTNPNDIATYLDKVKEMEATEFNALWRKDLIHLSGGGSASEQAIFKLYMNSFEQVAENEYLGGDVVTQSKTTNNETELINISEEVNEGKSLITFFGHSSSSITDIDIGFVSNDALGYNNKGKYPVILVNGCNAGDTYFPGIGFGLDWIITPNKGAISFIAHSGTGNANTLRRYTSLFYEVGYGDSLYIEDGIGNIQKEVTKQYLDRYINDPINVSQAQQMALLGDPAVKLFGAPRPDYAISSNEISIKTPDGLPVNVFTESFNLAIPVSNFGKAIYDSLNINVTRELSNGTNFTLDTNSYMATFYKDTLTFEIFSAGIESFGINRFTITLDPSNKISELDEFNNTAIYEHFIPLGGTINRYPDAFQIVDTSGVTLIAQSLDLLMGDRQVLVEIDTTDQFNSLVLQSANLSGKVLYKFPVDLNSLVSSTDTLVFYWRSKFAMPQEGELDEWSVTSFTYIDKGDEGWDMSHFPQFTSTDYQYIIDNQEQRKWEFEQFATDIFVRTFGASNPNFDFNNVELKINDAAFIFPGQLCTNNSINLLAFKSSTTTPYKILDFPGPDILDRKNCGRVPQVINNVINNELTPPQEYILQCINLVPENDFVVMLSIGNVEYSTIPATTLTALESIGANISDITGLVAGEPFILIGRKGLNPGEAIFITSDPNSAIPTNEQEIAQNEVFNGTITNGYVDSPIIGPVKEWNNLYFSIGTLDNPNTDVNSVEVFGIDNSNIETILYANINSSPFNLNGINPDQYSKIKLRLNTKDVTNLTPAQLQNWMVTYQGVPEGIIIYNDEVEHLEVQEGTELISSWSFENISNKDFSDSIKVSVQYLNKSTNESHPDTLTIEGLKKWESSSFEIKTETIAKAGEGSLQVFANPYLQKEKTYNNNIINLGDYVTVNADNTNPILEVTFDGTFIMDGDIVSPSPQILISVKDENTVLLKNDTLGLELLLKRPCEGCDFERINFSNPSVIWTPATENSNFKAEFNPQNLEDGIYTLSVQASDESGNPAGAEPYRVNFEVINESTITNFFPYPNPFSTSVRFVFTLTGSEFPDNIIIQIMTVAGTVVREITMDELGPLKFGNNLSEYAWNGKDEFGDQLANGVYLYRVKVYKDGQPMKLRTTSADRAFKHGIGKMYLLR